MNKRKAMKIKTLLIAALLSCGSLAFGATIPETGIDYEVSDTSPENKFDWQIRNGEARYFRINYLQYGEVMSLTNGDGTATLYLKASNSTNVYAFTGTIYNATAGAVRVLWPSTNSLPVAIYDAEFGVPELPSVNLAAKGQIKVLDGINTNDPSVSPAFLIGVQQIFAGTGVSLAPTNGRGSVTVSATGSGTTNGIGGTNINVALIGNQIRIDHADMDALADIDNSGATVPQDWQFDPDHGHPTNQTSIDLYTLLAKLIDQQATSNLLNTTRTEYLFTSNLLVTTRAEYLATSNLLNVTRTEYLFTSNLLDTTRTEMGVISNKAGLWVAVSNSVIYADSHVPWTDTLNAWNQDFTNVKQKIEFNSGGTKKKQIQTTGTDHAIELVAGGTKVLIADEDYIVPGVARITLGSGNGLYFEIVNGSTLFRVSTNGTVIGTVTSGVWNATAIDYAYLPISASDTQAWWLANSWGDHAVNGYHDAVQLTNSANADWLGAFNGQSAGYYTDDANITNKLWAWGYTDPAPTNVPVWSAIQRSAVLTNASTIVGIRGMTGTNEVNVNVVKWATPTNTMDDYAVIWTNLALTKAHTNFQGLSIPIAVGESFGTVVITNASGGAALWFSADFSTP